MGRKGNPPGTRRTSKRKEMYFNFNKLRKTLKPTEKANLVKFFSQFKQVFKELQSNIYNMNKRFDILESQIKSFQVSYLRDISTTNPLPATPVDDFVLNDTELAELFNTAS